MSGPWRAVAVDDEPPALKRLRSLLARYTEVQLAAGYSDPAEALRALREQPADLLFLDIQMPGMSGFDLLEALGGDPPLVVFVTAYDEHALRAFEVHAFDYLLKPIERHRFDSTIERVLRRLAADADAGAGDRLQALMRSLGRGAAPAAPARVPLRSGDAFVLVDPGDIDRVEVTGNTLEVLVSGQRFTFRDTLGGFLEKLPPGRFLRVHRSMLVNVDRIRRVEPWFNGDLVLTLSDGSRAITGRTYRDAVRRALGL